MNHLSHFLNKFFGTGSRIFSSIIRLGCLIIAFICLKLSVSALIEYDMDLDDLVAHSGILETIEPLEYWEKHNDKPQKMFECKLKLQDDSIEYFTGHTINYLTDNLNIGDTITVYTKEKIFGLSHLRTDPNSVSFGARTNEIYHLMKNGNNVIDFQKHREELLPALIMMPILTLVFFFWFLGKLPFNWRFTAS